MKDKIPLKIKVSIWNRDCHKSDKRIAQCVSCQNLVRIPESVRNKLKIINKKLPYECSGVGEYGHIESEHNGGLISLNNLRIQCKKCNTTLGSKNIVLSDYNNMDQVMIDSIPPENDYMEIEVNQCRKILKNGCFCKNKPNFNREFCHIHLIN